jgi:hypothetical protein
MSGRGHVCEVYCCPTRASRALWGLLEAADFLIEPKAVVLIGDQVSAIHEQPAPHLGFRRLRTWRRTR